MENKFIARKQAAVCTKRIRIAIVRIVKISAKGGIFSSIYSMNNNVHSIQCWSDMICFINISMDIARVFVVIIIPNFKKDKREITSITVTCYCKM